MLIERENFMFIKTHASRFCIEVQFMLEGKRLKACVAWLRSINWPLPTSIDTDRPTSLPGYPRLDLFSISIPNTSQNWEIIRKLQRKAAIEAGLVQDELN